MALMRHTDNHSADDHLGAVEIEAAPPRHPLERDSESGGRVGGYTHTNPPALENVLGGYFVFFSLVPSGNWVTRPNFLDKTKGL